MTDQQTPQPAQQPAPQESQHSQTPQTPQSSSGKNLPVGLIIGGIVAVLIIGAIAAYAFTGGFSSVSSLIGGGSDSDKLKQAFSETIQQERVRVDATLSAQGTTEDGQDVDVEVLFSGTFASSDEPQPGQGSVQISGSLDGESMSASAEYRRVPPRTYFLLGTDLVIPTGGEEIPFDLGALGGSWMYVEDVKDAQEVLPVELPDALRCEPDEDAVEAYVADLNLDDVFAAIGNRGTIELNEPDGDSETATLYALEIDQEKLKQVAEELNAAAGCEEDVVESPDSDVDLETLEIAIGQDSGLIRAVNLAGTLKGDTPMTFTANIILSNFGETPEVEEPEEARSLEEVMTELIFGDMFGGMEAMLDGDAMMGGTMLEGSDEAEEMMTEEDFEAFLEDLEAMAEEFEGEFGELE